MDFTPAEIVAYLPGIQRVNAHTIRFTGRDMLEVSRFIEFLTAYHRIFPLRPDDIAFTREAYRFFILHYVIANGDRFFRDDLWKRLQKEAVSIYLPAVDDLDLRPLIDVVTL